MNSACPHCAAALPPTPVDRCPRCGTGLPQSRPAGGTWEPTRLEPIENVRRMVEQQRSATKAESLPASADEEVRPFRPRVRPPLAVVCLVDDGLETGEWFRIRTPKVVLGRTQGEIQVPHDDGISGAHAEIGRTLVGGRHRWYVKDLNSTNGTFARVSAGALERSHEFLIGSRRFRFEMPQAPEGGSPESDATRPWQAVSAATITAHVPSVVEITPQGEGQRIALAAREQWIGTDSGCCAVVITGDPFVSRQHARIYCDPQDRWHIDGGKARNGLWLRIREITVESTGEFQAGEQRFLVKVLK